MKVSNTIIYIIIFIELCFSSCTNISTENEKRVIYKYESVPPSKVEEYDLSESLNYLDWFRKYSSYLAEERIIDSMVYGVLMQPVDFLVLKELDTSSVEMFNKLKKEYDGMEYYLFSFGNTQKTDVLKAKNVMQYDKIDIMQHIDFDIQNNFFIEDIYGRRKCKFYHLERTAGLKPYYTAIIAFEKVTISNTNKVINTDPELIDKTIIYEDMLFGSGIVKIMISKDKFELLPHILKKEI